MTSLDSPRLKKILGIFLVVVIIVVLAAVIKVPREKMDIDSPQPTSPPAPPLTHEEIQKKLDELSARFSTTPAATLDPSTTKAFTPAEVQQKMDTLGTQTPTPTKIPSSTAEETKALTPDEVQKKLNKLNQG